MKKFNFNLALIFLFAFSFYCSSYRDYEKSEYDCIDSESKVHYKAKYYSHWLYLKIEKDRIGNLKYLKELNEKIESLNGEIFELSLDTTYNKKTINYVIENFNTSAKFNIVESESYLNGRMLIRFTKDTYIDTNVVNKIIKTFGKLEYVENNWVMRLGSVDVKEYKDTLFNFEVDTLIDEFRYEQWYLDNINADSAFVLLDSLTDFKIIDYKKVFIFLIDSGIPVKKHKKLYHEDLQRTNRIIPDIDYTYDKDRKKRWSIDDEYGHGTVLAGLISATFHNGKGIMGLNQINKLYIEKVTRNGYYPYENKTEDAFERAINIANHKGKKIVINFSSEFLDVENNPMYRIRNSLIASSKDSNFIVVCPTGDSRIRVRRPARWADSLNFLISVGTSKANNWSLRKCNFSSDSSKEITLLAPGDSITSTYNKSFNSYTHFYCQGSSFSAAFVTATIALLWSINNNLTPFQIKQILIETCTRTDEMKGLEWTKKTGYGVLNVYRALRKCLEYK